LAREACEDEEGGAFVVAEIVQCGDVGVWQACCCGGFAPKGLEPVKALVCVEAVHPQRFNGDVATQVGIVGHVDRAEATLTEATSDDEASGESVACWEAVGVDVRLA